MLTAVSMPKNYKQTTQRPISIFTFAIFKTKKKELGRKK